jgi:cytoskeletal protein RodZ
MIKIVSNGKKLNKELEELEKDYSKGNISKKEYFARKRDIGQEMETLQAAEHVRRMQGRMGSERSLDYWSDQEEEKKKLADEAEKQEMFEKYITKPDSVKTNNDLPSKEWFGKKAKIGLLAFIVLAFVVGTSMGSLLIDEPSETSQVSMMVNSSAFLPTAANNTTATTSSSNTTTSKTSTDSEDTTTTTTPTTTTTTPTNSNTQSNSGNTGDDSSSDDSSQDQTSSTLHE